MTLKEKRQKLNDIGYQLGNLEQTERNLEADSREKTYRFLGVYLDRDNPTRIAIEALLRSHLQQERRRLESEYEAASTVKCDSGKGGDA